MLRRLPRTLLAPTLCAAILTACVVYEPYPAVPAGPSKYDRAWNAALGGVQDAGIALRQADPATGLIRGDKDGIEVTVSVQRQADGSVKVQYDSRGPTQNDPQLGNRFSQAYERRMGR